MNDKIVIHTPVSANSVPYYNYMIKNHHDMAQDANRLLFVAYCLDTSITDKIQGISSAIQLPVGRGSTGHAIALNSALKNFHVGCINVITDTDTVVLKKNWDAKIIELLETYDLIGTSYESVGGYSSGAGTHQTYKDVPTFSWSAFSARKNFSGLDMMPAKDMPELVDTEEKSRMYNLPVGFTLVKDVGWKAPKFIYENQIKCLAMFHAKPTSSNSIAVKSGEDYHEEYQLPGGEPFVAHQRGSMKHAFRMHHLSRTFYDACETYIAQQNK